MSGSVVRVGAAVWVCWWSCWFRVCGGCEEKLKTVSESVVRWSCRSGWSWRLGSVVRSCRLVWGSCGGWFERVCGACRGGCVGVLVVVLVSGLCVLGSGQ